MSKWNFEFGFHAKDSTNLGLEEEEALAEFQFLTGDEAPDNMRRTAPSSSSSQSSSSGQTDRSGDDWGVDYSALNRKKEIYQKEAMTKKGASHSSTFCLVISFQN